MKIEIWHMKKVPTSCLIFVSVSPHVSLLHFQEHATNPLWKKREGVKQPLQTPRLWGWVTLCKAFVADLRGATAKKTSRQVWNSESVQWRGGVFADRPLVHPRTPAPSLWCLCAFVNEEILIPWWDIALSWAASAASMPSTSAQSYSRPTQPQSHQAPGFTFLVVRGTAKSSAITDGWHVLFFTKCD